MEIKLGDAVAEIRDELLESAARGAGQELAFAVGPVEMEFTVELRSDAKARAGFKAWVVSADVESGIARGRTHKVKVTLHPRSADGGDLLISGGQQSLAGRGDASAHVGR